MLDDRSLAAFEAAATHLNFTRAARAVAMTQSGVSQHIARIEEALGAQLFHRVNRKVFLTGVGKILLEHLEQDRERQLDLQEKIHGETAQISGLVRYAMPNSCLLTPHLSEMLEGRDRYPQIRFEILLCPNDEIFQKLLENEVDFGFVTKTIANPALQFEPFCQEEYVLVANRKELFENLPHADFISYPGMDVLYKMWARHALPSHRRICPTGLRYAGKINSIYGAITMVEKGLGATVIPKHCVQEHLTSGRLFAFTGDKKRPLLNHIYLVWLKGKPPTARMKAVLEVFREMKNRGYVH